MRIAVDAMGGDEAPQAIVDGAYDYAISQPDHEIILVGQEDAINACLKAGSKPSNIRIHHAPSVIAMADKISALKEKPDDSMNVCSQLVKAGEADAMVLCGNTACSVAAAQLHLRRIPGVKRAGILTPLPNIEGLTWVCDCGANAVGKPEHLAQFASMASIFLEHYDHVKNPKVGVLSIGSEEGKGNELSQETLQLLKTDSGINLIGNIEGNDIYSGDADVVVCDGFTGNVVLKASEGIAKLIGNILREELHGSPLTALGGLLAKKAFKRLRERTHWSLVGGCLLLGVNGICIIGHGRSDRVAVSNAIKQASRCIEVDIMSPLRERFASKPASA